MLLNRFRFVRGASLAAMSLLAGVGAAQVQVVDGVADYQYNVPIVTQNVDTGYGNNLSELDVAWAYIKDGKLYLTLAGNLENSGNKLNIFIDSVSGGQNRLRGDNLNGGSFWYLTRLGDSGGPNGLLFETGFEADYFFGLNLVGGSPLYVDYSNLPTSSGGSGSFLGEANPINGVLSGGSNPNNVKANYNGTNTGGVAGGTAAGYAKGGVVTTGFELEIPLAAIGNPTGTVRVVAFIGSPDNSSLSNQFLPGVGYNGGPVGNYGEPRGVNLGGTTGSNVGTHYFIAPWVGNGNIAVSRVSHTSAFVSGSAYAGFIDEYSQGGTLQQTVSLPTTVSGSNKRVTIAGLATSEGYLNQSMDGRFLTIGGYDADVSTGNVKSAAVGKTIAIISQTGSVDSTTSANNLTNGRSIRSTASLESNKLWFGYETNGAHFIATGDTNSVQVNSSGLNGRNVNIFNNQLYMTVAAGVNSIGPGIPETGSTSTSLGLSGLSSAYDYWFANAVTLYVASDQSGGGIYKFAFNGTAWVLQYNINSGFGSGTACRAVTGLWTSATNVKLFAVVTDGTVRSINDDPAATVNPNAAWTTIVTAGANTVYRGVRLSHFTTVPNQAPVLDPIGGQSGNEESLITFDANATDPDSGQTLTYSLVGAPAGASIDSSTGVFTFTPTEAQGPGSFTFDVVVTDNGTSPLSDSETITVTVNEVNVAPVLDAIGAQSGDEETLITFDANASDVDLPANTLTFSLTGAPAGASIDSNTGVFTWTPTEAQSGSHTFDVVVSDGSLTDTESITVTVNEVNVAPVLDPIGAQSGDEETLITFDANASDADLPAQTLTFSLVGAPSGATIDANTGVFSWTPTEAQDGPHTFTVKVTDDGSPNLSDEESITVTVNEVNVAPVLDPIGAQSGDEETLITFDANASDADLPAQTLTFSLTGAPAGASIDGSTGVFTWTPTEAQDGSHTFDVVVSDGALTDTETITVTVNEVNVAPVLDAIGNQSVYEDRSLLFEATATDGDADPLTYSLSGAPYGAYINPTSGAFHFRPAAVQTPGSYTFDVVVSDGTNTDSETITVTAIRETRSASHVWVWGSNSAGLLGIGDTLVRSSPSINSLLVGVSMIYGADVSGHARKPDATWLGWGANNRRQIGDGTNTTRTSPVPLGAFNSIIEMGGSFESSMGVTGAGVVYAWGWNDASKLGLGPIGDVNTPTVVGISPVLKPPRQLGHHSLWILYDGAGGLSDGGVLAAGNDGYGQLGNGASGNTGFPTSTLFGSATQIATGAYHSVALAPNGTVYTAGFNQYGQLGNGTTISSHTPIQVPGLTDIVQVAAAGYTSYAVRRDGAVFAWGDNPFGQVGDGTTVQKNSPVLLSGITGVVDLRAGFISVVALKSDGTVWAWGSNTSGQLGQGGGSNSSTPLQVPGLTGIDRIQANHSGVFALRYGPSNQAPVLDPIGGQSGNEESLITFDANATDPNSGDTLTYSLVGAPAGATIDSSTGVFTFTPTEAQGPGSFTFDVVVTDNGTSPLSDTETITVTVNEVNVAPVLDAIGAQSGDEETLITFDANASDVDLPANTLTFSLTGAPAGASIDSNTGVFTWTPTEAQSGSHTFDVVVSDGSLTDTESITVTVNEVNVAPVLDPIGAQSGDEETLITFDANASDADLPAQTLTFSLVGAPAGASIDGNTGVFSWTPTEAQDGPHTFTVKVTDDGSPNLSDEESITITVNEVNVAPTADSQSVNVAYNTPQSVTLTGSDTDLPAQTLSFSVVGNPTNGTLSGTAPNLTYTPNVNYSGGDSFTFKVNDGVTDSALATVTLTVAAGAPMTIQTFGSPAPNGFGSPSFAGYVANALNSLENGLGDIGDRTVTPTAYEQETQITWRDITVASFPLWLGQLNPASPFDQEYGNRLHFGVRILGNGTLFSLEMLEFDMDSSDPANDLDFNGNFVGFNYSATRFGIHYGPDRVKGGGDDTTYTSGNGTTLVDEIVYVGIGNAWWAQGAGTEAEQLMDTRCYIESLAPISVMTTYRINDGVNILGSGSATVTVMPTNVLPTAQDQNVSTPINTPLNVTLVATDPDNEPLDYTVVVGPTNGSLSGTAPNLTYTPNTNFVGVDTFTFKAADCVGDSNVATVTITVQAPDPIEMRIVGAPAPNAFGSPNWEAYLSNAITSLKDDLGTTGDRTLDPAAYQEVTQIPWKDIVVSGFNSWRGLAGPGAPFNAEYGNRLHFGVRIQGNGRRIKLSDVEVTMTSSDPNNDLGFSQDFGALSIPYSTRRTGLDYGPDRDRGTTDDFMVTSGPGTTEVDELIFIGLGNAWDATFETGTDQEKLEAVRCYIEELAPIDVTSEYRLKDGLGGYLVTGTATVTVVPTNVLPTAQDQNVSTDEDTPVNITLNATDPDNEPLDYTVVAGPTSGLLSGTAPNLTYTPNANFAGVDTFTFKATDCVGDSNVATVTITVNPLNDAPTIDPIAPQTVDELTLASFNAVANDPDAGESLTFSLAGAPAGALIHPTSGAFTWTPTEAQGPGSFTFDVQVTDSGNLSATTSVTITVNEVNVAPVANSQSVTTDEDQSVNITLAGTDDDLPANTLTYSVVDGPTNGNLSGTAPNLTYTPNANYNGSDSFTFKINDGQVDSNIATVTITVDPVNDAPTAVNDDYSTAEDTLLDVDAPGVLGNDSDLDVGLTAILVSGPSHGTLNLNSDGSFEYTPQANFNGVDTFTYKANDGQEDSNVATVTITVTPVNDIAVEQFVSAAPNFYGSPSYAGWESNAMNSLENGLGSIGNRTTDPTAYEQLGAVTEWGDGVVSGFNSWRGGATPPVPFQAELGNRLHFGVRILGNGTRFKLKNLYNDMNSNDLVNTFDFDGDFVGYPYRPWRKGIDYGPDRAKGGGDDIVYMNGESEDLEVDELIYSGVGNAFDATFGSGTDQEKLNEVRCYISDNQPLIVDNRYEIRDDLGVPMAQSTVSVVLDPLNGVPVAHGQSVTTDEDTPVNITLTATDPDTDPLTWEIVTPPTFGNLSGTAPNLTYTPNANYAGADSFTFRVNDGICDSNIATVSITVTPVNDVQVQVYGSSAPNFFGSPSFGGYRDNALNGLENGLLSVGDRNTNPTGYEVLTTATWRDIVVAGFPLWRGTINPSAPFDAEYGNRMHFGLRILGNGTRFKLSNLKFDMNSSDPDNSMDFEGDFVGGAYSASRKGIDYGPDRQKGGGDDVVYTNGESGDLEVDEFIYVGIGNAFDATPQGGNTPAEELLLTRCYIENVAPMDVSVAYTICDDLNQPIATGTGTVTIVPSNVLPTADNQSVSVDEDGSVNIDLTASDPDNEPLTFSVMSGPTFGNLSGTAPNLTYTPNANFAGIDSFTFIASDCVGDSNVATITITVNPVNDPPSLEDIAPITVDELTLATFIANAADPDLGDSLMFTLIGAPAGATIHPTSGTFNWTPTEAQGPGVYTFDVQVTDSGSQSATKSVTITVNEVNVAPELTVGNSHTVDEGQLLTFTASATDSDDPANTLTYSLVGAPSGMSINPTSGEITWTPTEAQGPNSYTLTVKVTDDGTPNLSDEESVTVTVNEVNEAPVAQDQTVNTDEDDDVDITLVATDNDLPANTLNYIIVDAPLNGTLSGTAPNLTYTPNANWSGTDTFTFKVNDGTIDSNIATVTINVASINDAPVAGAPGDASVSQGQNLFLNLTAADVDADPFDVKVSLSVSNGKLTLASNAGLSFILGDGSMDMAMEFTGSLADVNAALTGLLYKHTPGFNGTDTLVYVLNDLGNSGAGGPLSDTKNVLIDIVPAGAQIFFSSGYIVHAGEEFTGGLSTLLASDDDRLSVFNDPVTLAAAVEFYATSPINCPLELRFRMEHSASRPGLAYFLQLFNYDTNTWDINVGDSEVLSDLTQEVILTNSGALAHVNVTTGETRARIEWAPINDEDPAQDGWLHNVDLVRWRATP